MKAREYYEKHKQNEMSVPQVGEALHQEFKDLLKHRGFSIEVIYSVYKEIEKKWNAFCKLKGAPNPEKFEIFFKTQIPKTMPRIKAYELKLRKKRGKATN